jgi:predicted nucleic acid-binding protein
MKTMTNETVCVDASLIVALLMPERYTSQATNLWEAWVSQDFRMVAPSLLGYEVTSALYRKVLRGMITPKDGQSALKQFVALDIEELSLPELHFSATELARQFNQPNTYAAHYLALSKHLASALWTADERLYHTVRDKFALVRWIEENPG